MSSERIAAMSKALSEEFLRTRIGVGPGLMKGASVAICHKGEVIYRQQFGSHQPDSVYNIFSMTKILTTVAVLQLQDRGQLHIDDPVSKYLPAFLQQRGSNPDLKAEDVARYKAITIKQCLNHTCGILGAFGLAHPDALWTAVEEECRYDIPKAIIFKKDARSVVTTDYARTPLMFEPGAHFHYSVGHTICQTIIEEVSGKAYEDYLRDNVTEPLGMKDTAFLLSAEQKARVPELTLDTADLDHPVPACMRPLLQWLKGPQMAMEDICTAKHAINGAYGLKSTMDDHVRLAQMLLAGGTLDGVTILSPAAVQLMCTGSTPELVAPFAFQGAPATAAGQFGVPRKISEYRAINSWPGQRSALGVLVVEDPEKAGLHPSTAGMCWWQGMASTYFAFNPETDIACIVFGHEQGCGSRRGALVEVVNAAHEALCSDETVQ